MHKQVHCNHQMNTVVAYYLVQRTKVVVIVFFNDVTLQIHFLYQFSLQFFLEIFSCVLSANKHLHGITNYASRLSIISTDLFQVC